MTLPEGPEPTLIAAAPHVAAPAAPPVRGGLWQVGLRTLLLLMVACAVWAAHFSYVRHAELLERENAKLQPLVRELVVQDLDQAAIVKEHSRWFDEFRWQYYLPEGRYQLALATREIGEDAVREKSTYPNPVATADLIPGRHVVSLEQVKEGEVWRVRVLVDDQVVLDHAEPSDWNSSHGSTGAARVDALEQFTFERPIELFRRRFSVPAERGGYESPRGPANGVLLWIERLAED
ncbi:MAG: hypothetical protein U0939_15435 [Pirellulales bacterium]